MHTLQFQFSCELTPGSCVVLWAGVYPAGMAGRSPEASVQAQDDAHHLLKRPAMEAFGGDAIPDGPRKFSEVLQCIDFMLARMSNEGHGFQFWHGKRIVITSKWCGLAGMCIAMELWARGMRSKGVDVKVDIYSCTEWNTSAQVFLSIPSVDHLLTDLNDQHVKSLTQKITSKQMHLLRRYMEEQVKVHEAYQLPEGTYRRPTNCNIEEKLCGRV